jgi:threonine/homoserine/homoserine lactone efflux protein
MSFELFLGLLVFAFVAAFTPGPNNTLLMASGMQFGFRRTMPLVWGVTLGFPFMIGLVGLGLGGVFQAVPLLYTLLKYAGAAYMLYLAWKIASASLPTAGEAVDARPLGFVQMVLFQWINPKGWVMAVTALSAYTLATDYAKGVAVVVATFLLAGITSALTWAGFGAALKQVLHSPRYFRLINLALGALLVVSLVPLLRH